MESPLSLQVSEPSWVSDEILLQRLREGDAAAGNELAERHVEGLTRYLRRLVNSDHVAEDLHQHTWSSVLEHVDRFDATCSGGGFKAWLYRIATNKANDYWRTRGREETAKQGLRLVSDETVPHAGHRMEGNETEEKLRRAIASLPENQRQVLFLRFYSELKFVEIAQTLGCPLNTALGRMHKALARLKEFMME